MPWTNKRILLVNDDPLWLKAHTLRLESLGVVILAVNDGLSALKLARLERPDLVIADIVMPVLNGFELCRCIRGIAIIATTPIILFSNLDLSDLEIQEAKIAGANAVLPGSPDLADLLKEMARLLTRPP